MNTWLEFTSQFNSTVIASTVEKNDSICFSIPAFVEIIKVTLTDSRAKVFGWERNLIYLFVEFDIKWFLNDVFQFNHSLFLTPFITSEDDNVRIKTNQTLLDPWFTVFVIFRIPSIVQVNRISYSLHYLMTITLSQNFIRYIGITIVKYW